MPSLLLITSILLLSAASAEATTVGVAYNPSGPNLPPPERVVSTLQSLCISAVRLLDPSPAAVRAFAYTNITLLLTVPNHLIPSFAANRSAAALWLHSHVLPYYPRTHISLISAGSDVITTASASSDPTFDPSTALLPAMRNLRLALFDLGIRTISVSTTFSFIDIMTTSFPPSSAEFQEPIGSLVVRPLLQFLDETNSSFLINLYPYNIFKINSEIPVGFVLFQEHPFNFRDDVITGVRYRNLFDMMVDAVIAAMAVAGQESVPVIVTETWWPSDLEAHDAGNYAEMYLRGLLRHLRSGLGTPLRKEGVAEAYVYELFDEGYQKSTFNNTNGTTSDVAMSGRIAGGKECNRHDPRWPPWPPTPKLPLPPTPPSPTTKRGIRHDPRWPSSPPTPKLPLPPTPPSPIIKRGIRHDPRWPPSPLTPKLPLPPTPPSPTTKRGIRHDPRWPPSPLTPKLPLPPTPPSPTTKRGIRHNPRWPPSPPTPKLTPVPPSPKSPPPSKIKNRSLQTVYMPESDPPPKPSPLSCKPRCK